MQTKSHWPLAAAAGLSVALAFGPTLAETPKRGGMLNFVVGSKIPSYDGHRFDGELFVIQRPTRDQHAVRPRNVCSEVGDTQTALFPDDATVPLGDYRIDDLQQVLATMLVVDVEDDDPLRHADLWGCETDARCRVHRLDHVLDQRGFGSRQIVYGSGLLFQRRVGVGEYVSDRHCSIFFIACWTDRHQRRFARCARAAAAQPREVRIRPPIASPTSWCCGAEPATCTNSAGALLGRGRDPGRRCCRR